MTTHESLTATPPKEWATKTTAFFSPESGIHPTSKPDDVATKDTGSIMTLEPQLPGAYPDDPNTSDTLDLNDAKDAAIGVLHAAKEFLPTQQDVGKAVKSASETAKYYLHFPSSSDNAETKEKVAPAKSDDPRGGDEKGVAKLPDERDDRSTPVLRVPNGVEPGFTMPPINPDSFKTSASSATNFSTQAQAGSDATPTPPSNSPTPPTRSSFDMEPATGDVGKKDLLPDDDYKPSDIGHSALSGEEGNGTSKERAQLPQQPILNLTPRKHAIAKPGAKWKDVAISGSADNSETELGVDVNAKDETPTVKNDTEAPPIHTASSIQSTPAHNSSIESARADADHFAHKRGGSTISNKSESSCSGSNIKNGMPTSSSGSPRRSKFMDRVKGEVKVISGKLAHNEEKVQEGRRMMGRTA